MGCIVCLSPGQRRPGRVIQAESFGNEQIGVLVGHSSGRFTLEIPQRSITPGSLIGQDRIDRIGSGVCRRRVASRWRTSEAGQSSGLVLFGHRIVDAKLALTVLAGCRQFASCLVAVVPRSTDQAGDRHRRPNEFAARRWQAGPAEGVGRRPPGGHVA